MSRNGASLVWFVYADKASGEHRPGGFKWERAELGCLCMFRR